MSSFRKIVLIGGSAGSLNVLLELLPELHSDLSLPIVIVLHRKYATDSALEILFASKTNLPVREVAEKEPISAGVIYTAPADYHVLFEQDGTFSLDFSEKVNFSRPSIDVAFESAAEVYGPSLVCILLSGASADGVKGMKIAKEQGAILAVQDPTTAEVPFMPEQALLHINIDSVIPAGALGEYINSL